MGEKLVKSGLLSTGKMPVRQGGGEEGLRIRPLSDSAKVQRNDKMKK